MQWDAEFDFLMVYGFVANAVRDYECPLFGITGYFGLKTDIFCFKVNGRFLS